MLSAKEAEVLDDAIVLRHALLEEKRSPPDDQEI